MNRQEIQLQKLSQLAGAGRLTRFLHNPFKYLYAMYLIHIHYPATHKGSLKTTGLFFGGNMQVLLPAATDIYLTGGKTHDSEIRLAKYLSQNLENGQHFLDIGAHFGYFTLMASSLVGNEGRVLAIEPSKGSFNVLNSNTSGNQNVATRNNAVSDKLEQVSFYEFPVLYSEYNALNIEKFETEEWIKKNNPEKTTVNAVTIDALIAETGINPDIIKIDVEGAEVQAISGGSKTWQTGKAIVIMEYLDEEEQSSYTDAADILYNNSYHSYMIKEDGELEEVTDILSYMRQNNLTSENIVFKKNNKTELK